MGARNLDKKRIWVVDDDVRTTHIFARMLREDGHEVDVLHDGAAAIEQLSRSTFPDILVTDIQMPHADGIAIARCARASRPSLPIFFVTAYPERVSRRLKWLGPVPQVFVKPLDYAALALELSSVIQGIDAGE
jgi:CheY-like chemotaxis protein